MNTDRLLDIKRDFVDEGLACLLSEGDIEWMVAEIERLRTENGELRGEVVRLADGGSCPEWDKSDD